MKIVFLFLSILFVQVYSAENSLYMPLNISKAYQKGTRSYDGNPGETYWQNRSEYDVQVRVYPSKKLVKGEETVRYFNHSPDSLYRIVIRLYQNFYLKGNARDWAIDPGDLHEGVDLYDLRINGFGLDIDDSNGPVKNTGTVMRIDLEHPLAPGSSLQFACKWKFTLPGKSWVRMGAYADSALFVAYWYPQISVYDDIDGWDYLNYSGTQEFYNDMSKFNVRISAPADFLVWATGLLQNADQILREPFRSRFRLAAESDSLIHIVGPSDIGQSDFLLNEDLATWHFLADHVPDFAFAVCRNYRWDALSVDIGNPQYRRVLIQAVYPQDSPDFFQVAEISKAIIEYLSLNMPGIPYPYPSMTAFNRPGGGGGMEFPMMVNDGSHTEKSRTVGLTGHEIIHSYFPFYTGINERKYAWMDEGWAVALNFDVLRSIVPDAEGFVSSLQNYMALAGKEYDVPMMVPSTLLQGPAYRNASYNRSAVAYQLLRDHLGDELFRKCMKEYVSRWKYKHPIPYDFFFTFDQTAKENLAWFWIPWFFQSGYADLGIESVKNDSVVVVKTGLLPVPVEMTVYYEDGSEEQISKPMSVWKDSVQEIKLPLNKEKKVIRAMLNSEKIPDVNDLNDEYILK